MPDPVPDPVLGRGSLRELLAHIVASTSDAIFSRRLDGTVTSWNGAAEQIFGYTAGEMVGCSSALLLPPGRKKELPDMMRRIRRGERIDHFETVRIRKDGQPITISLCVSPLFNAAGAVVGASSIARDVTTQRQLETELLQISERERRRLGRDLHDGLGQQLGGVELLCRTLGRKLSQKGMPEAEIAGLLTAQIREAIEQTRALARGLTPILDQPNGLMLGLEDLAETNRRVAGIVCTFKCEQPVLLKDLTAAVHLFRIAQESIGNAIRHGAAKRIDVRLLRAKDGITLRIRDNGKGLPSSTEQPAPPRGMGLRIMHYRASVLGGALQVEPAKPRGVVVTCTIPAVSTQNGASQHGSN